MKWKTFTTKKKLKHFQEINWWKKGTFYVIKYEYNFKLSQLSCCLPGQKRPGFWYKDTKTLKISTMYETFCQKGLKKIQKILQGQSYIYKKNWKLYKNHISLQWTQKNCILFICDIFIINIIDYFNCWTMNDHLLLISWDIHNATDLLPS